MEQHLPEGLTDEEHEYLAQNQQYLANIFALTELFVKHMTEMDFLSKHFV